MLTSRPVVTVRPSVVSSAFIITLLINTLVTYGFPSGNIHRLLISHKDTFRLGFELDNDLQLSFSN